MSDRAREIFQEQPPLFVMLPQPAQMRNVAGANAMMPKTAGNQSRRSHAHRANAGSRNSTTARHRTPAVARGPVRERTHDANDGAAYPRCIENWTLEEYLEDVRQPFVRILEQPASKGVRFRYERETQLTAIVQGASSTPKNRTYPTIQFVGHRGKAIVVISCVTKDAPHRPHPHNLIGTVRCKRGVYVFESPSGAAGVRFEDLSIQRVKQRDVEHSLKIRQEMGVDPFQTGFPHFTYFNTINLNVVRLCFQVFIEGDTPGKFTVPLPPVVSEPIYDKKVISDLNIIKLSDCFSYVDGGRKDIILLCEKVMGEDIQVRFYEETGEWEAFVYLHPLQVHKQHAIWFRTPRYKTLEVTEPLKVFIQLCRPSDGATGEPLPFLLLPLDSELGARKRKRKNVENPSRIQKTLEDAESCGSQPQMWNSPSGSSGMPNTQPPQWNFPPSVETPIQQSSDILLDLDSPEMNLNSDELDAVLKTMGLDSTPLPVIENLSFSDGLSS